MNAIKPFLIGMTAGLVAVVAFASQAEAGTIVSVEAAGVANTTLSNSLIAVEDFEGQTLSAPPTAGVVVSNTSFSAIGVGSTWSPALIQAADPYGGAGGTGKQAVARGAPDTVTIDFTGRPLNYFGVWASAIDGVNTVEFWKSGTLQSSNVLTGSPLLDGSYVGNPFVPFLGGGTPGEKYAFFNFRVTEGYDQVRLIQNGGGGFEFDNVSIGSVPEPQTWAMLIVGFGMVGLSVRRRRPVVSTPA